MKQLIFLVILLCGHYEAADRAVYKVLLTQRGYAQYLQYDVETTPIREFTLCSWFRTSDLNEDQAIFSYVVNSGRRIMSLYITSGGTNMKILLEKAFSSVAVNLVQDSWQHVCLSYQADHGAWALYLNGRLVSCEAFKSLGGFALPGNGKLLIGYGTDDNELPIGLEGDVFGVNMLFISTIEKNIPLNLKTKKEQTFTRSKKNMDSDNAVKFIILDSLNYVDKTIVPVRNAKMKFTNKDSSIDFNPFKHSDESEEKEILDMPMNSKMPPPLSETVWNIMNSNGKQGKFKKQTRNSTELSGSGTQDLPSISIFETPPPVSADVTSFKSSMEMEQDSEPMFKINPIIPSSIGFVSNIQSSHERLEVETPPPPDKSQPVFGQWSSSQFSGKVLNYLKSINFMTPPKKVPSTISLPKLSDSLPYHSNFKVIRVHAPLKFQRKKYLDKQIKIMKRHAPQINVQIIEENTRDEIIRLHALTRPINVEVTFRGENKGNTDTRRYRDVEGISSEEYSSLEEPRPFSAEEYSQNLKESHKANSNKLNFIIPYVKPKAMTDNDNKIIKANLNLKVMPIDLNKNNNWSNIRQSTFNSKDKGKKTADSVNNLQEGLSKENQVYTGISWNHKPSDTIDEKFNVKPTKLKNHRFPNDLLSTRDDLVKISATMSRRLADVPSGFQGHHSFDKPVKIGNALNERLVIGVNEEDKKRSFVGGDENVPDINRYRSDLDNDSGQPVPPSLAPKVCRSVELLERVLFVQADGSVDKVRFASPSRVKNIAVNFILNLYKNCSLENTQLDNSYLLFIDWKKTPIKLLGGAYPKKTKRLCGFF